MNFPGIKHSLISFYFGFFLLFSTIVHAQSGEYDFAPRIRSYLQRPVSETERFVEDVSIPRFTGETTRDQERGILPEEKLLEIPKVSEILIDKKIDPEFYIVGPGDLINIYLWGELDQEYPLRVSPEGFVIIPTVGPVMIADLTLAEARKSIYETVNKKYKEIEVTVYLVEPRRFRVFISGVIENPGMYNAHPLLRASDLLADVIRIRTQAELRMLSSSPFQTERGQLLTRSEFQTRGEKKGSSKRSIVIYRGDKELNVDLLRFEKLGDLDSNPYVSGGDHINIPPYQGDIMISGEVNNAGIFEYKGGDSIYDLVNFSGGLTAIADTSNASLSRFDPDGISLSSIPINLYDALYDNPDDPKYLLHESDRLFIQTKYNYKVLANVIIDGQVKFPGDYPITPHQTKLTDLVKMAGGFTEFANLEEARIIRRTSSALRDLEYERLSMMLVADMSEDEYEYFKSRSRISEGLISIDFVKLFRENNLSYDILVEEGDHIFIPIKRELINILGAVQEPGFVRLNEGQPLQYYINIAGGYTWNAKTRGTRIIKAKTGQRLRPGRNVNIEGGDTIHVPEKKPIDYWQGFLDTTTLFAQLATLVIIARNLTQ